MSEAKKPAEEKAVEKKVKKAPAAVALTPEKSTKTAWTLERCLKTARRFSSEKDWASGAPAAYKSAVSHGWVAQCTAKMPGAKTAMRKSA